MVLEKSGYAKKLSVYDFYSLIWNQIHCFDNNSPLKNDKNKKLLNGNHKL